MGYVFPPMPWRTGSRSKGHVYLIQTHRDLVKIGWSKLHPDVRCASLQCGCPFRLEVIGWFHGSVADEMELHRRFARCQWRSEWFAPDDEMWRDLSEIFSFGLSADGYPLDPVFGI